LKLGLSDPGEARLAANARAQAFNAAFSVEAWDIEAENTATDAAPSRRVYIFMVVFLV
jgi:hypothetical protein